MLALPLANPAGSVLLRNMYTQFFQLKQAPFSIAPDPRYLFMSERHREALAHLLYGVSCGGGFVLLTGEIGTGKTTVCRCLLEQMPANCTAAYVFNPKQSVDELLQSICEEFRIDLRDIAAGASPKQYVDRLNAYLLQSHAAGRNNVLIIDEAQNLSAEVLEQLRLLTNLETSERKLLQIILIGQPELRGMLACPELEQLAQRVVARYHLGALSLPETASYIQHRLASAGLALPSPFPGSLVSRIHRLTRGVPRRINLLCDRALLGAYTTSRHTVTPDILKQAAHEVFGETGTARHFRLPRWRTWQYASASLALVTLAALGVLWSMHKLPGQEDAVLSVIDTPIKLSHSLADVDLIDTSKGFAPVAAHKNKPIHALPEVLANALNEPASLATSKTVADLGEVFNTGMRDEHLAYRYLGQLWGVALTRAAPCEQVRMRNIQCYRGSGGLDEIRRLNRPVILLLRDPQNVQAYALLTVLTPTTATLRIAGSRQNVELNPAALARHFRGEFVSFWRAPPAYRGKIRLGASGEDVDWLATQLARLNGAVEIMPGQPFSQAMVRQLRDFQATQGLPRDGVAGPKTLMLLNNATAINEPRLQSIVTASVAPGK